MIRYASNKASRAQLGTGLHEVWINDVIQHCGTKALLVCDFAHGVGEVMKAAVNCKVVEAATTTGVRVCTWGQDPRKIFAEIGQAVGRTELSKLYVSGKLVVPGHQPVPDPGSRPENTQARQGLVAETLKQSFLGFRRVLDHPDPGGNRQGLPGHLE